jgi:hypothetical protein
VGEGGERRGRQPAGHGKGGRRRLLREEEEGSGGENVKFTGDREVFTARLIFHPQPSTCIWWTPHLISSSTVPQHLIFFHFCQAV